MKNFWKFLGVIAFIVIMGLSMAGCTSTRSYKEPVVGVAYNIAIPAKDFQIIGIVRVETRVDARNNGELITYDALLKAAEAAGGNGIVNIMIDRKEQISTTTLGSSVISVDGLTEWYGSALAIRYTDDNLPEGTPMSTSTTSIGSGVGPAANREPPARGLRQ